MHSTACTTTGQEGTVLIIFVFWASQSTRYTILRVCAFEFIVFLLFPFFGNEVDGEVLRRKVLRQRMLDFATEGGRLISVR